MCFGLVAKRGGFGSLAKSSISGLLLRVHESVEWVTRGIVGLADQSNILSNTQ